MNRKQRRAKESGSSSIKSADDIPMSRPNAKAAKGKTLLDLAAERQAQLDPKSRPFDPSAKPENIVQMKIGKDGRIVEDEASPLSGSETTGDEDTIVDMPFMDTLLFAVSLTAINFTLSFLAMHQYAQEVHFQPLIIQSMFVALPTLAIVIHFLHGHLSPVSPLKISDALKTYLVMARTALYLVTANVAGCYLVRLTNQAGYYAVMKNAPAIGTLWVWAVLELGLVGALGGVIGPGVYAWWYGYGIW